MAERADNLRRDAEDVSPVSIARGLANRSSSGEALSSSGLHDNSSVERHMAAQSGNRHGRRYGGLKPLMLAIVLSAGELHASGPQE